MRENRSPAAARRIVGRDADLDALITALVTDRPLTVVAGEAGVGKTRLIHEALDAPALADHRALIGEAHPVRGPFALGPVLRPLDAVALAGDTPLNPVVGALRPLLPRLAPNLPPLPEPLHDPQAERHRTLRAVLELVQALSPAVLVLEDLQWADARTVELLALLATRPPGPTSVVISYRPADVPDGAPLRAMLGDLPGQLVTRIALEPLPDGAVGQLAARLLGGQGVSAELEAWLAARSGGLPFVVEQDVRLLREREVLIEQDGVWHHRIVRGLAVPRAVGDPVVERATRLSPAARAALESVAVLGTRADDVLVRDIAGLNPRAIVAGLSEALASGLLDDHDDTIDFRHALARDAIYQAIPGPRRQHLHQAAAHALERRGSPNEFGALAHHYAAAGDSEQWARCAEAAGDLARSVGEDEIAYRYFDELLRSDALTPTRRAELTLKLGWVARMDNPDDTPAMIELVSRALATPGLAEPLRAQLLLLRGWYRLGDPDTAPTGFHDLRAAAADLDDRPSDQARALATLAAPWAPDTPLRDNLAHLAAARAAAARADEPDVHAYVAANAVWLLTASGDPTAVATLRAMPADDPLPSITRQLLRGLNNAADCALDLGHYRLARETVVRALEVSHERRYDRFVPYLERIRLRARWRSGDLDGLEAEMRRLLADRSGGLHGVQAVQGELLVARGELDAAAMVLRDVLDAELHQGALAHAARAAAGLVRIALARDDEAGARALTARVLDAIAASEIWVRAAPLLVFAPVIEVEQVLAIYRDAIADRDAPFAHAALALANGRVAYAAGDRAVAAAAFAVAAGRYGTLPDPRHQAVAQELQGEALVADPAAAQECLHRAWRTFTKLGAPWEADRVVQHLQQAGLPMPRRGGRRSYGRELSPREREVAALAAAGSTNAQIAAELFLSPRTVDSHLANILRKLGLTSRQHLAAALDRAG